MQQVRRAFFEIEKAHTGLFIPCMGFVRELT